MGSGQSTILPLFHQTPTHPSSDSSDTLENSGGSPGPGSGAPAGYPRLAERMGVIPEQAIFRRFGTLNSQRLLYLQAEIIHLEQKLTKQQLNDSMHAQSCRSKYARSWYALSHPHDGDGKQWKLVQTILEKLKEYNTAIIQQDTMLRMSPPSQYDLQHVQKYLESPEMGPLALFGVDSEVWGSVEKPRSHADDLISLLGRHEEDSFSKWVTEKASKVFFRVGWPRAKRSWKTPHLQGFEDADLLRWSKRATSIVASILPICSILLLNFVYSSTAKLVIIAVFNMLLSLCLRFFTQARSVDLFAVASAFSAVQVVFVQTGISECTK